MHMVLCLGVMTALLLVFAMSSRSAQPATRDQPGDDGDMTWGLTGLASDALETYAFPLGQLCIAFLYGLYRRFTLLNIVRYYLHVLPEWDNRGVDDVNNAIFLAKYVPAGIFTYRMIKNLYLTSRARINEKQIEIEDIQLQIQIVKTKLCVRDAEFTERAEQLRRGTQRLRAVRARVRAMIAADDALRRALESATPCGDEPLLQDLSSTPEEERQFIIDLLKELKTGEQVAIPECLASKMDCGEHMPTEETPSGENSVYSSLSDVDTKQDCLVKIVKVTNVYKVAYLKHFIKQKRLRRATQQALLKKKIENIRKLLEGWKKSLNAVINSKVMLDSTSIDMASQEAMGDYSKPNLRESSDSDCDLRTSGTDVYNDDYGINWSQNPYEYSSDDAPKEFYDSQEYNDDFKYAADTHVNESNGRKNISSALFVWPEETLAQIKNEEANGEYDAECQDLVVF